VEWRILIEATRRVSLAVARLVGANEALSVLQDILEDCSAAFPPLPVSKLPFGYLQVTDSAQFDRIAAPRTARWLCCAFCYLPVFLFADNW